MTRPSFDPICRLFLLLAMIFPLQATLADGPADNLVEQVRPVPPPGVPISEERRNALETEAARLKSAIEEARGELKGKPSLVYLPDVEICHKAVDWALRFDEFYDAKQTDWADGQLKLGFTRLEFLKRGQIPWIGETGLVPRGYLSKIDGSVQPFGLVVPESYRADSPHRWRLDSWFHGRGETLTELDFLHQRLTNVGEFTPRDTIVLHPYGRYCNGQRFAGEVDFFEALEVVKRDYRIDEDRIVVRGFSLGGAACWHIATHHAWQWCAANPGAGFSETEEFLNFFQGEKLAPLPWERQMWNLYDSTTVARNLFLCPTVAYSGEIDKQRQAAEAMANAISANGSGLELKQMIGPKTAHSYEKSAKAAVASAIDAIAARGRNRVPREVKFETYTLKTNRAAWIQIDSLGEHWQHSAIDARYDRDGFRVKTENVTSFTLRFEPGTFPEEIAAGFSVRVSELAAGEKRQDMPIVASGIARPSDRSLDVRFSKNSDGTWKLAGKESTGLRKKHGLQGPVDDAFMDSFLFVRPTGKAAHDRVGKWAKQEMDRAVREWRRQFRGDVRIKDDRDLTDEDIQSSNLVLWGDPASNSVLAGIAPKLAIQWTHQSVQAGNRNFSATDHALICIYPNPLNPKRYVVLNSGFTYREYDNLNNARQTPKLPDWAVIDLNSPPSSRHPGGIPAAGFFDESWELKPIP